MTTKLILDLDTGIDDALALAYALGSEEVDLIGAHLRVEVDVEVAVGIAAQFAARHRVQGAVDGFVGHVPGRVVGV